MDSLPSLSNSPMVECDFAHKQISQCGAVSASLAVGICSKVLVINIEFRARLLGFAKQTSDEIQATLSSKTHFLPIV